MIAGGRGQELFDDPGEMFVFQPVYLFRQCVGGVVWFDDTAGLEDDPAMIVELVHIMDGDARLLFFCSDDSLMYQPAIKSFPPVFGQ